MKKISDQQLLTALIVNGGVTKTAAALGMTISAIYKRMCDADFRRQYDTMQSAMLNVTASAMTDGLSDAVSTLLDVIRDTSNAATVRCSACDSLLRHCAKYVETASILRRLDALEEQMDRTY